MNRRAIVIPENADLPAIVKRIGESRQTDFPVVDSEGRLVGMLSQTAVREALADGERLGGLVLASDLAGAEPDAVTGEDTLLTALRRLGRRDVTVLPVVSPDDRGRLEGVVSRQDVMAAYERALTAEGH